jgi:hypothetical protein
MFCTGLTVNKFTIVKTKNDTNKPQLVIEQQEKQIVKPSCSQLLHDYVKCIYQDETCCAKLYEKYKKCQSLNTIPSQKTVCSRFLHDYISCIYEDEKCCANSYEQYVKCEAYKNSILSL